MELAAWDLSWWQTAAQVTGAVGAAGAAGVAFAALRYFKRQAKALSESLDATREQMTAEQERWEDDRHREVRRAHALARPTLSASFSGGVIVADVSPMTVTFSRGEAVRDVKVEVELIGRQVAGECRPAYWQAPGDRIDFVVGAAGMETGDKATLRVTYLDILGSMVRWTQPMTVKTVAQTWQLEPVGPPSTDDDLGD